jgi:hypothetical protein
MESNFQLTLMDMGEYVGVRRFKYEYTHSQIAPRLYTSHQNGKKYIIPTWQEVLPETTLNDVEWVKPKRTPEKQIKGVWEFESSSSKGKFYSVKQNGLKFTCNCPGFWVAKDREKGCKHIQLVKKQLKK